MKKIRLAFWDRTRSMTQLVEYLCKKNQNLIETRVYTEEAVLKESAEKGQIDVLLALETEKEALKSCQKKIPQVILLSEGKSVREQTEFPFVFLYQPAADIVAEILAIVAENDQITYSTDIVSNQTVEMIGGFAPFGGGGVSSFLLGRAADIAKEKEVLYINFEEFHGLSYLQTAKRGEKIHADRGMSEVLFYLRQGKGKLALKLDSLVVSKGGVDHLFSVADYRDLYDITSEDMEELLRILSNGTKYETLCFDIGVLMPAVLCILKKCRVIYMPEPVTQVQISKREAFERNMLREGYEELLEKIEYFRNRRQQ